MPPQLHRTFAVFGYLVFLAVSALIVYQSFDSIAQFGHHSQVAGLPMDVMHLMIPVSFGLIFVLVLGHLLRALRRPVTESDADPPLGTARQ